MTAVALVRGRVGVLGTDTATELSDELASFLRELLDRHGERILPARLVLARRRRAAADMADIRLF